MSHLRPEDSSPKTKRAACRRGRHTFGVSQNIGAGIVRQVCEMCGEVTIDLTGAHEVTTPIVRTQTKISTRVNGAP